MRNGPINTFKLEIVGTTHGFFQSLHPIDVNTLDEVIQQLNDLKFNPDEICIYSQGYSQKRKLADILLELVKRSFTITRMPSSILLDEGLRKPAEKIQALLKRNNQFNQRKIKIALASPFLAMLTSAALAGSFPLYLTLTPLAFWIINNYGKKYKSSDTPRLYRSLSLIILYSSLVSMFLLGINAFYLTFFFGFGGLFVNYLRDREIKYAITKYNDPDRKLNDDELTSLTKGFEAQKSYFPFLPKYWSYKCPRANLVGYHSSSCDIAEKIVLGRKNR